MNLLDAAITKTFQILYYCSPHTWNNGFTRWMGVPCYQLPSDLWVLQEIIFETKPTLLIETGSAYGGTALFYANIFDQIGKGEVISIDTQPEKGFKPVVKHKRITFIKGMSTESKVVRRVKQRVRYCKKIMVMLDSDHSTENVLAELRIYSEFVTPGCYLIIHDTLLEGHPYVDQSHGNPGEAVKIFLKENDQFHPDRSKEKFYMTFMPGGFLWKKVMKEEKDGK